MLTQRLAQTKQTARPKLADNYYLINTWPHSSSSFRSSDCACVADDFNQPMTVCQLVVRKCIGYPDIHILNLRYILAT